MLRLSYIVGRKAAILTLSRKPRTTPQSLPQLSAHAGSGFSGPLGKSDRGGTLERRSIMVYRYPDSDSVGKRRAVDS